MSFSKPDVEEPEEEVLSLEEQAKLLGYSTTFERVEELLPGPKKISMWGETKMTKTTSALSLAFLDLDYIDELKEEGFRYIPYALENGIFAPIKKIKLIDSEGFKAQMQGNLRSLFGDIVKNRLSLVEIPSPTLKPDPTADNSMPYTKESIALVTLAYEMYMHIIKDTCNSSGPNDLIIIDCGTRMKNVFNDYAEILYRENIMKGRVTGNPKVASMEKFGPRNSAWRSIMSLLKNCDSHVVITYKVKYNPEFAMKKDPRLKPREPDRVKQSQYEMDVEFDFDLNMMGEKSVMISSFRGIDDEDHDYVPIKKNNKFSFLYMIEELLEIEMGDAYDV